RLYGLLMGTAGCGALGGAVLLALRSDTAGLGALVGRMAPLVGLALAVFALSPSLWLSVPALLVLGFAILLCVAGSNTLIQTAVDNDYRGRVMALFTMAFLGLAPLGSFAVGSLAHAFGVRATLVACGLASCAAGLAYRRGQRARAG
ncbi:MAG: MFS transporter, partial [Zoogloea sp.]|nr:MFS transporter [Zoogloea sp.]